MKSYTILYSPPRRDKHTCSFWDMFTEANEGYEKGTIGQCQCGQYAKYNFGWRPISEKRANKLLTKAKQV